MGAAILSTLVFALLLAGGASPPAFAVLGALALAPMLWRNPLRALPQKHEPIDRPTAWILSAILIPYGILYLVHALAPERQPDAVGYHLGLVAEHFRLGRFPDRIDFYGILPQGMEMLYLFAFSFGRHSAAKLVHFGFLIATAPVMVAIGRRLGIADSVSWIAAAFYLCAPVVGISGTSAYTDAGLVCSILSAFYFLLAWRQDGEARYLIPAGLLAGFSYAIKLSSLMMLPLAGIFVLLATRRSWKTRLAHAALLSAVAAITILPWMVRSFALTGNPVAPLFNAWFPNPYFPVIVEQNLAKFMRTYEGFTFRNAPWELTMGGASHGILGPLFLALPLGLLALRTSAGRWLWIAGGLLALPWFVNVGTRFLMPSLPFFALALALVLPRRIAWAALAFHAVTCWPAVIARYERAGLWRLAGFPLQAAVRLLPEPLYLRMTLADYQVAEMISKEAKLPGKIFGLTTVANAYLDHEVSQYWQSALAVRLREELLEPYYAETYPLLDWSARWKERRLTGVRFRLPEDGKFEWEIHEAEILRGEDPIRPDRNWRLVAWPNLFEAPFALDGMQSSRWRTWDVASRGMFFEVQFSGPQIVSGANLTSHWVYPRLDIYGRGVDGKWSLLADNAKSEPRPKEDLLKGALLDLKRNGFGYILAPKTGGNGDLGTCSQYASKLRG